MSSPRISKSPRRSRRFSASTKIKQKLGPSAKIRDAIKLLERAEGSVKSETIELHRENGVDHVYASLGKVSTKMVLDTGASFTTISAKLAGQIGLKPKPSDPTVRLTTADGTVIEAKQLFIPSVRVGKFTVQNVECAVMPAEKGNVDPLLGQTFFKHFKVEYSRGSQTEPQETGQRRRRDQIFGGCRCEACHQGNHQRQTDHAPGPIHGEEQASDPEPTPGRRR